jgi:trimeric autotransporter adhesin
MKSLASVTRCFHRAPRRAHAPRRRHVLRLDPLEDLILLSTFTVTNTNNSGTGSLRQAILNANSNPGPDTIAFNLPGGGVHTIKPTSALPTITDAAVIDGTTQPGYAGTPLIDLNGTRAGANANGLRINADDTTVRGLVINGFSSGSGVYIYGHHNNSVLGNYIGTDATGTAAMPNKNGVMLSCNLVNDCTGNQIGTSAHADGNVISGNTQDGVQVTGATQEFTPFGAIEGNRIGTTANGAAALGNGHHGVSVTGTIWGGFIDENVISANHNDGIQISQGSATRGPNNIYVFGNTIGANADITAELGNAVDGVNLSGATTEVNLVYNNYILASGRDGVRVDSSVANQILSNFMQDNLAAGIQLVHGGDHSQAAPVITSAVYDGTNLTVQGTVTGPPNNNVTVDVFMNYVCHPSGYGEGQLDVGEVGVTTDASGRASFTLVYATTSPEPYVSATTSPDVTINFPGGEQEELAGDTSQFSRCFTITSPNGPSDGVAPGGLTSNGLAAFAGGATGTLAPVALSGQVHAPVLASPSTAGASGLETAALPAVGSDTAPLNLSSAASATDLVFADLSAEPVPDLLAPALR